MSAYPCTAHRPVGPRRVATALAHRIGHCPDVGILSEIPSSLHTVVCLCRTSSCDRQFLYEGGQRQVHIAQSCRQRRPVVLLYVYVAGVVARPRRQKTLVPESLQVGWHAWGTRTTDEQVAAVVEVEFFKVRIALFLLGVGAQLLFCGSGLYLVGGGAEFYRESVVILLVVADVALEQLVKGLFHGLAYARLRQCLVVTPLLNRVFVGSVETRDVGNEQQCLTDILQFQFVAVLQAHATVFGFHLYNGSEVYATVAVILKTALSSGIAWPARPCRIAVYGHACQGVALRFGCNVVHQLAVVAQPLVECLAFGSLQPHYNNRVGR